MEILSRPESTLSMAIEGFLEARLSAGSGIGPERAPVGDRPREGLAHEKCREFGTDGPHVHERADHAFRLVGAAGIFKTARAPLRSP
jgi:hypothetical protein